MIDFMAAAPQLVLLHKQCQSVLLWVCLYAQSSLCPTVCLLLVPFPSCRCLHPGPPTASPPLSPHGPPWRCPERWSSWTSCGTPIALCGRATKNTFILERYQGRLHVFPVFQDKNNDSPKSLLGLNALITLMFHQPDKDMEMFHFSVFLFLKYREKRENYV